MPESLLTETLAGVLQPDFKTDVRYRLKAKDSDSRLKMILDLCIEALVIIESMIGKNLKKAKLRVFGYKRAHVVRGYKTMAQNISRIIKYLQCGYKPKTANLLPNGIIMPILS